MTTAIEARKSFRQVGYLGPGIGCYRISPLTLGVPLFEPLGTAQKIVRSRKLASRDFNRTDGNESLIKPHKDLGEHVPSLDQIRGMLRDACAVRLSIFPPETSEMPEELKQFFNASKPRYREDLKRSFANIVFLPFIEDHQGWVSGFIYSMALVNEDQWDGFMSDIRWRNGASDAKQTAFLNGYNSYHSKERQNYQFSEALGWLIGRAKIDSLAAGKNLSENGRDAFASLYLEQWARDLGGKMEENDNRLFALFAKMDQAEIESVRKMEEKSRMDEIAPGSYRLF